MALERDLEQQCVTVVAVNMDATVFVLKLQLLKCGRVLEFKTDKAEGVRKRLIFVHEEGNKIQTTLFGQSVEKWTTILVPMNAYYIINGRIRPARLKCNNVNKVKELSITQYSEIRECTERFQTIGFSNGFISLSTIDSLDRELCQDVLGIIVEKSGLLVTGGLRRRIATISSEINERVSVTLWGDFAEFDGLCLDSAENCKTVVAFSFSLKEWV